MGAAIPPKIKVVDEVALRFTDKATSSDKIWAACVTEDGDYHVQFGKTFAQFYQTYGCHGFTTFSEANKHYRATLAHRIKVGYSPINFNDANSGNVPNFNLIPVGNRANPALTRYFNTNRMIRGAFNADAMVRTFVAAGEHFGVGALPANIMYSEATLKVDDAIAKMANGLAKIRDYVSLGSTGMGDEVILSVYASSVKGDVTKAKLSLSLPKLVVVLESIWALLLELEFNRYKLDGVIEVYNNLKNSVEMLLEFSPNLEPLHREQLLRGLNELKAEIHKAIVT